MGPLSALIVCPMLGALALLFAPRGARGVVRAIAVGSSLPPLAVSIWLISAYDAGAGGFQFGELLPLLPSLGIQYKLAVDGIAVPLVFLTATLYTTAIFTSWTLARRDREFFIWLSLLVAGVFGVFTTLDLFLFFLFYELAVLPMYLLIGIWGSSKAVPGQGPFASSYARVDVGSAEYGAMKLTLYLLAGSAFILVGLFLLYVEGGKVLPEATFDYERLLRASLPPGTATAVFLLFYLGFGILAGIWPFHTWSPDGHAAAPAAGSMMHAGVLMKLGAYGVLRLGFGLFPETGAELAWLVGGVAAVNIVYGAIAAGWQTDVKYLIAYSSVSHMGIVMLGMATLNEPGLAGSVFQMVSHGIMTAMLFTLVNLLYAKSHTRDMRDMGGFAAAAPGMAVFFTLGGLASLGLPGLSGFVAEFLVFLGAWTSAHPWWLFPAVAGAFVTSLYILRAMRRIFLGPADAGGHHVEDARGSEWVSLVTLGGLLVVLGVWPRLVLDTIRVGVGELLTRLGG
jgi:NADH-quinone oxidoreductase subunit M